MRYLGVDTHKWLLVAVAVDEAGRELGQWQGPNTPAGWAQVTAWAAGSVTTRAWGLEGSGGYGRGLAQALVSADETVYEINPRWTAQSRRRARRPDKSDRRDARAIAQWLRQEGASLPPLRPADATSPLALLTRARQELVAQATRLRNQLHQLLFQLEPDGPARSLDQRETVTALQTYAVAAAADALTATRAGLVRVWATQLGLVMAQAAELGMQLAALGRQVAAPLTAIVGVGDLTAGMLAGLLGPGQRFADDAQLAAYAGVAPLETGSAGQLRHRLNRSGNRTLNMVVHRIVLTQSRCYEPARRYLARRMAEGKSRAEAVRALKRYVVRAIWRAWQACDPGPLATGDAAARAA